MQDQYVGDIGDFGKYGLLRHLTGMRDDAAPGDALRLGVVWYLFPDEAPKDPNKPDNRDGSLTGYLRDRRDNHKKFRNCDTDLYDALHKIVVEEKIRNSRESAGERDTHRKPTVLSSIPARPAGTHAGCLEISPRRLAERRFENHC